MTSKPTEGMLDALINEIIAEVKRFDRRGGLGFDVHEAMESWVGGLETIRAALPGTVQPVPEGAVKAKWVGDTSVLQDGADVTILAVDHNDPSSRKACWIRHWPAKRDYPVYRSCDLTDLDFEEAALVPATLSNPEAPAAPVVVIDALRNVIAAWEATKSGQTSVREIERWLIEDMKPAIDAGRAALVATPPAPTSAVDGEAGKALRRGVSLVEAFLRYSNPNDLPEDRSQQWQQLEHWVKRAATLSHAQAAPATLAVPGDMDGAEATAFAFAWTLFDNGLILERRLTWTRDDPFAIATETPKYTSVCVSLFAHPLPKAPIDAGVVEALRRAERKLTAYVGVCKGDKELTDTVLPMVREALEAASQARDGK